MFVCCVDAISMRNDPNSSHTAVEPFVTISQLPNREEEAGPMEGLHYQGSIKAITLLYPDTFTN